MQIDLNNEVIRPASQSQDSNIGGVSCAVNHPNHIGRFQSTSSIWGKYFIALEITASREQKWDEFKAKLRARNEIAKARILVSA
jgi:hypothetical protein